MPCITLPAKYVQLLLHCYNLELLLKHIASAAHAPRLLLFCNISNHILRFIELLLLIYRSVLRL